MCCRKRMMPTPHTRDALQDNSGSVSVGSWRWYNTGMLALDGKTSHQRIHEGPGWRALRRTLPGGLLWNSSLCGLLTPEQGTKVTSYRVQESLGAQLRRGVLSSHVTLTDVLVSRYALQDISSCLPRPPPELHG